VAVDRERLAEYTDELLALVEEARPEAAYRLLRSKLLDLLASGTIERTDLAELARVLRGILGPVYARIVRDVEQAYEDIVELTNEYYRDLGLDLRRDHTRIRAIERTLAAEIGRYKEDTVQEVARRLRIALVERESPEEAARRLIGVSKKVNAYAETLAQSQLMRYARVLKVEKALQAEVQYFEYVGLVTTGTRPFCRSMVGQICSLDTILLLRNANREPVIENCGGWRCVHLWEPDLFATEQSEGRFVRVRSGSRELVAFTQRPGLLVS
jgi:hypothetical protein